MATVNPNQDSENQDPSTEQIEAKPDVTCAYCKDYYVKPTLSAKCQHNMCKECWEKQADDSGAMKCSQCDVAVEKRHLRMNFNKEKEVRLHIKSDKMSTMEESSEKLTRLKQESTDVLSDIKDISDSANKDMNSVIKKINNSETIMVELVREHHESLREQVRTILKPYHEKLLGPQTAIEQTIVTLEFRLEQLTGLQQTIQEDGDKDKHLQVAKSIDFVVREGNKDYTEFQGLISLLHKAVHELEMPTVRFIYPDIPITAKFLQQTSYTRICDTTTLRDGNGDRSNAYKVDGGFLQFENANSEFRTGDRRVSDGEVQGGAVLRSRCPWAGYSSSEQD